jgi:putative nucleotidyltransferase with HDIG domain
VPVSKQGSLAVPNWVIAAPRASVLVWAIGVAGVVVVTDAAHQMVTDGVDARWPVLAGLTVAGAVAMLKLRAAPVSFSISDTFTLTTLFLLGPAPATITAALEALTISALLSPSQRRPMRILFNVAAVAIAMRVAGGVLYHLTGRDLPAVLTESPAAAALPMLCAVTIYFLLNTVVVSAAVASEQNVRWSDVWRTHFAHLWFNYFGGAYIALLLTLFAPSLDPMVLVLLMPMPLVIYGGFRMWVGRINDRLEHLDRTNRQYRATIEALAHAIDAKDQVTHGHIHRVQTACLSLAQALGCTDTAELQAIEAASLLHDLGKLAIPEHILNKPGRLTAAEFTRMKEHAAIGADILSGIEFPYPVVPIVRHHHENWNGGGYPDGLSGTAIPLGARILAVVDCYDALTSDRPYRPAMCREEAVAILRERRGTMYDPEVVDTFLTRLDTVTEDAPDSRIAPAALHRHATSASQEIAICASKGVSPMAASVTALLSRHFAAAVTVLYAYDLERDGLRVAVWCGAGASRRDEMAMALGERLSGWVGATRRTQVNADPHLDAPSPTDNRFNDLRSALSVPIERSSELAGVLTIYARDPNRFTPADASAAELVARVLAQPGVMPQATSRSG